MSTFSESGKARTEKIASRNQTLRRLFNEARDLSGEEERGKFEITEKYNEVELRYHLNRVEYVVVYFETRGHYGEATIRFKTSTWEISSRRWLPLFNEKTTAKKVLKTIFELRDAIYQKQKWDQEKVKKQESGIERLKKDLGINNKFTIRALRQPGSLFQEFELESISNNCKLEIEPSYDGKYSIKFKIDNVKETNLESVVSSLIALELM